MGKRRRESDSDDAATEAAELKSLFVDTSLDTHFVMLVSSSDTVLDLKKKLALEHKQCFPEIGEIQVHSLKVKRRSKFYHLPDIILVWTAFQGRERNWFVSVDVSSITITDDDCRGFTSDTNRNEILPLALTNSTAENNYVSDMIVRPEVKKPAEKLNDYHRSIYSEELCTGTESRAKKKLKVRHTKDASHNSSLEGGGANMFCPDGKDGKCHTMSDFTVKVSGTGNDQFDVEDKLVSEEASPPTTSGTTNIGSIVDSQNLKDSNIREEDTVLKCMMDSELGQDVPANHSGSDSIMVPDSSSRPTNAGAVGGDVKTASSKMKKKNVHKTAAKIQDITIIEQIGKGDNKEEGKDLPLENEREVIMPSNRIVPDHVHPDLALKESSLLQDVEKSNFSVVNSQKLLDSDEKKEDNVLESKMDNGLDQDVPTMHSGGVTTSMPDLSARVNDASDGVGDVKSNRKKRKKKLKSISVEVQDTADVEQIGKGEMKNPCTESNKSGEKEEEKGLNSKGPNHDDPYLVPKEASIMQNADAVMEPEISSGSKKSKKRKKRKGYKLDVEEKAQDDCRKEADFVTNTQTEQTLEDASVGNKKMACHADFPSAETENTNMESNQVDKDNENPENKYSNTTKKRKKQKHTAKEIHENMPVKEQQAGIEPLATTETSIGFVNSELEGRPAGSSQVLSRNSEETVGEMHEIVVSTDDLSENSGKGIAGIDFKQYFLPGEQQYKVDSCDKVRKEAKLQKSSKNAKNVSVPSVKISSVIQNSVKSFENKKTENNNDSERTRCDTTHNSDWDEMSPSLKAPGKKVKDSGKEVKDSGKVVKDSGKELKDSSPSELCETTPLKPKDIVAASTFQNKKNPSFDKSSSKRPESLLNNMGNRRLLPGLNGTNMMPMKTPKKNSLLAKPGSIFQDNSGESSGDENGTIDSDDSTASPSDSSSMSGNSGGLSDVSQNSTCNGSNDGKEKSTPRKNTSNKDEPISKNLTMDMILKNSARFKKAKQVASQS